MNRPKTKTSKCSPFTPAERRDIARYIAEQLTSMRGVDIASLIERCQDCDRTWTRGDETLLLPLLRSAVSVLLPRNRIRRIDSLSRVTWLKPPLLDCLRRQG